MTRIIPSVDRSPTVSNSCEIESKAREKGVGVVRSLDDESFQINDRQMTRTSR